MCGLAEATIATSIIGGLMQFQGMRQQGKAAKDMANYEAAVARENAKRANYLAEDAIERGKEEEAEERLRGRMLLGAMRAELASSGQEINSGSARDLQIDQAAVNELNARTIRNNAQREAEGFRIRASQFETDASLQQISGQNSRNRASNESLGTLLTTGSKVAGKWYEFDKAGAFS